MLHHPCILGGTQRQVRGAKSEVVPNKGEQNLKWLPHPCLRAGPKEGGNATSPLHSWGYPTPSVGSKIRSCPQQRGTKSEVAASRLPSRGPKRGRKCYVTPAFLGYPTPSAGSKISCGPQQRGTKFEVATSPLPSSGPKRGRKCYVTLAFLGIPNAKHGEQNQKWLPHPRILGGPKEDRIATSHLDSWGSPTKGNKIRSGCLTPAFSGAQKRAEMLRHPCILGGTQRQAPGAKSEVAASTMLSRGPKRGRKCYVTPAFSGMPNKREQNQKWLPDPCLLGGPKEGGNDMSPLHSRRFPTPSAGSKMRSGPQQRGTKSEVAASPLPSRGPKRERKCYAPRLRAGEQNEEWPERGPGGYITPTTRGVPTA